MSFSISNLDALVPMKGMCYSPAPSDDTPAPPPKYFDTDFTNSGFPLLWGGVTQNGVAGRNDLKTMKDLKVNFVHLYDWSVPPAPGTAPGNYQRDHLPFLDAAHAAGIKVMVPVSNYFMGEIAQGKADTVKTQIKAMVAEIYGTGTKPHAGAGMWGFANEFDLHTTSFSVENVVTAMQYLTEAETALGIPDAHKLPICAPVSFAEFGSLPPGISAIQSLQAAVSANSTLPANFWTDRYVAALNTSNGGTFLATYISTTFPQYFPDLPFFLSEMGVNTDASRDDAAQATFVAGQLSNTEPSGKFLGRCVFQFLDQTAMKTGTEATFGMLKFDTTSTPPTGKIQPSDYTPGGGESYPVDKLSQKPLYQTVKQGFD